MRSGEFVYGRYLIRTLTSGAAKVSARAFAGGRSVMKTEGRDLDGTIAAMQKLLDERDARERAARQDGIPTAQEFGDAFARLGRRIGQPHWRMLRALLAAPDRSLTVAQLAAVGGCTSLKSAHEKLEKLARMIGDDLECTIHPDGSPMWMLILTADANSLPRDDNDTWRRTMRQEVAECLVMIDHGRAAA
jgi:hypothetical protein